MKKILTALTFVLLFVIQTSVGSYLKIFNVSPNLLLTFVIIYSVNSELLKAALAGCVCGLLTDAAGAGVMGYNALLMMYIAAMSSVFANKFYNENKLVSSLNVFIIGFIYEFIKVAVFNALYGELPVFYMTWRYILPECIFNSISAIPLAYWINWLKNEYIRGI